MTHPRHSSSNAFSLLAYAPSPCATPHSVKFDKLACKWRQSSKVTPCQSACANVTVRFSPAANGRARRSKTWLP